MATFSFVCDPFTRELEAESGTGAIVEQWKVRKGRKCT